MVDGVGQRSAVFASIAWRKRCVVVVIVLAIQFGSIRRSGAEDRVDLKYMYYQEDDGRIQVLTPAALIERDLSPTVNIKIEGIYNAISGASPTGAPLVTRGGTPSPAATESYSQYITEARENEREGRAEEDDNSEERGDGNEDGESREGRRFGKLRGVGARTGLALNRPLLRNLYHARAGATPQPQPRPQPRPAPSPAPSPSRSTSTTRTTSTPVATPAAQPVSTDLPTAEVEDERTAFNIELSKKIEDHTVSGMLSYSTESDYESVGLSLRDAIDFNKKNTTLTFGGAYTHDLVDSFARDTTEDKDTIDAMVGLTQVLGPATLFTVNLTLSQVTGFLDDQYKIVELNGVLVPEKRPDNKDKQILFLSLSHFFKTVQGAAEVSYRYYDDTFGIRADTYTLSWHQKLGRKVVLTPMLRWYQQTEADFYGIRFEGSPSAYSSDYRISALEAVGYGLKLVWSPSSRFSVDLAVERYEQSGTDGVTPDEAYPAANVVTAGARWWF